MGNHFHLVVETPKGKGGTVRRARRSRAGRNADQRGRAELHGRTGPTLGGVTGEARVRTDQLPGPRLPVAPLLAGATAKVLAAMSGQEPLETSVNSED